MQDLLAALALVLVLEGILPFLNPGGWREAVKRLGDLDSRTIRIAGGLSMITGLIVLQFVRG
ncbi:MAG: DUF2065 domain-containing protein [Pseudomonadota bacterium]